MRARVIFSLALGYALLGMLMNSVGIVILQSIEHFGATKTLGSTLEACKDLSVVVASFLLVAAIPRFGYRRALIGLLATLAIACALATQATGFGAMQALFVVTGLCFGISKIATYSMIGVVARDERDHASITGLVEGVFMLGVLAGAWVFGWFVAGADWLNVYWVMAGLCLFVALAWSTCRIDETAGADVAVAPASAPLISGWREMFALAAAPVTLVVLSSLFLYVLIEQGIGTWLPTLNREALHLPASTSVQMSSLFVASLAAGRLLSGLLLRRYSWLSVLLTCLAALACLIVVTLPLAEGAVPRADAGWVNAPLAAYLLPLMGLFLAPIYPTVCSVALSALPRERQAPMIGLIVIFSALGGTIGSLMIGLLFQKLPGATAFYFLLLPLLLVAAVLPVVRRRIGQRRQAADIEHPARLFGPLYAAVQEHELFNDSKTFADAVPRRAPPEILADWRAGQPMDRDGLRGFVHANFDLPEEHSAARPGHRALAAHIEALWPLMTRSPTSPTNGSSELWLPERYVVPGGRFRELYYWDTYFTMLGLARSGRQDLIESMIANFGSLLDRLGHIPNGTRTYYASRSHPPFFHLIAAFSRDISTSGRRRRLGWMVSEHRFWMAGSANLAPGSAARRVVRLPDGALVNRYWDDLALPRDESWREDVELAAQAPGRDAAGLWRDIRAAAESGWDFSSRWLADDKDLATIRTTRLVAVDLNALLHGLEQAIAEQAEALGETALTLEYRAHAERRARAIERHLWNDAQGFYADLDLDTGAVSTRLTAATVFPLLAGVASPERARRTIEALKLLIRPGGIVTTLVDSGQQWDAPNGWAPLQWIAIESLRRYGNDALADTIADRWLAMVEAHFLRTGDLLEKYDVESCASGIGGQYVTQIGFGWTNGVVLELLAARNRAPAPQDAAAGVDTA